MVVSSLHGHDTQAAAYAKLRLIYTIIFSSKGGTKTYRLARDAQVAQPFCRHETSWHFFSRGLLYASWTHHFPHDPPHPCGTPDAACMAAFHQHPCGPGPTWEDDLTPV